MSKEFHFELENKLTFADVASGNEDQTMAIIFKAPTYREMDQAAALEQHIYHAFKAAQGQNGGDQSGASGSAPEASDGESPDEMDGTAVMVLLSMFSNDLGRILADFEKLALKVGFLAEKTPLMRRHFQSLDVDTIKRMCGEYIAFFIMPSVLSAMATVSFGN